MSDRIIGTTQTVSDRMRALNADVLREDNILFRTCEHGIRHPVGTPSGDPLTKVQAERHSTTPVEERFGLWGYPIACDGCCETWRGEERS